MLSDFCRKRLAVVLAPREVELLRSYMIGLLEQRRNVPRKGAGLDWPAIAAACLIDETRLRSAANIVRYGFDALARALPNLPPVDQSRSISEPRKALPSRATDVGQHTPKSSKSVPEKAKISRRGRLRRAVIEFPCAAFDQWDEPTTFHGALDLHMRRHGDTCWHLHRAVVRSKEHMDPKTIVTWRRGQRSPRSVESLAVLTRIERRYRLPAGYLKSKLPHQGLAAKGHSINGIGAAERRRLAWHLPDDFDQRPLAEREQILEWVRRVVVSGSTDYRRYQAAAQKQRYAVRFQNADYSVPSQTSPVHHTGHDEDQDDALLDCDPEALPGVVDAPRQLAEEMATLLSFKMSKLVTLGYQRLGVWGTETASQKTEHFGLLFGSLVASPTGPVCGRGVPLNALTFGLLVFPAIWDWYVQWRERRRGFYTAWEVDMLHVSLALTRQGTGWLRQMPILAERLRPVPGLVTMQDIERVRGNWLAACDVFHEYASGRAKKIKSIARVHRDPFEPILPILEAPSPVAEYRKITEEIRRMVPDERRYPKAAAETVRSFLMLRLGLHLGLRQKNLRQLLFRSRGLAPTSERRLEDNRRGELRWSDREGGWEVLIPAAAFKNAHSSFFAKKPFRLILPDLGHLYDYIEQYLARHRQILLGNAVDPGTFFVKTVKVTSRDAAYDQATFYEAWRLIIQRYGIFNPYTGRGVIEGLLPHGPHNVRDVLATHILKKTGSYEQASYAIQDTPEVVAQHYGRFLPQDKAALAAKILNQVWESA